MDRQVESPDPGLCIVTSAVPAPAPLMVASLGPDHASSASGTAWHFPAVESGRELRALIASFLL
jgi:hypothetical protein